MKILIIGSRGFIGSHCVDYFNQQNHDVWGCDVIMDYNAPKYIWLGSIDGEWLGLFREHKFDVCINCSGAASVPFSLSNPYNDFNLNTLNVFKLLEAIRIHNSNCKFITMSSAAVYGNPERLPIKVGDPIGPVSPYGFHKVQAEYICEEYHRFFGLQTCCLRIFSAYGPRLKKQLFWDMYNKFKQNDVIELWGTGQESRDFIFISDLVRAIDLTLQHGTFQGDRINVANGRQRTIAEVAERFVRVLGTDKEVRFNGAVRKGDPINWEADITDLKNWGYVPEVSLEEGIKKYVTWVEKELQ